MRALRFIETINQDLRHGLRVLWKDKGFSAIAMLSVALGIASNTAIFSIVRSVLIQPLPFVEADRLLQPHYLTQHDVPQEFLLSLINRREVDDWRRLSRSFERIATYRSERLLPMLGIQPALGRNFAPEDRQDKQPIILSDGLWRRRFGANPRIIGQTIRANAAPCRRGVLRVLI